VAPAPARHGRPVSARDDELLAERLRRLSFTQVQGSADPSRSATATINASADDSALPGRTTVTVEPVPGGWHAAGAWQGDTFVADLYVITTPHRVRLVLDAHAGTAVATWSTVPLTTPTWSCIGGRR
jgi:hypothetical protein